MRNTPVAEEWRHDHFHLAMHLVVPFPEYDNVPVFSATTSRHSNGRLVAVGPLFAIAAVDMPYPGPGIDLADYVLGAVGVAELMLKRSRDLLVYGTGGKKMKENLCPAPTSTPEPLW